MPDVLISTIYEKSDSTKFSIRDFNVKKIFLLLDKETKDTQKNSINLIKKAFNNALEIIEKRIDVYSILSISRDVIKIIDSIRPNDEIYVDISQGRKTQALGVLLACYTRSERIKKIVYWNGIEEMIILPNLTFNVNYINKKILREIESVESVVNLAKRMKLSRAQLYRNIKNLESGGLLIKEKNKFILTDAGKIAIM